MFCLVQAICQGGSSRLVYDPADSQTGNFTRFLGGLALSVVKVGRNGNHRFGHFMTQVIFSCFLHFLKHHGTDFLWGVQSAIYVNPNGIIVTFCHFVAPMADFFCHFAKLAAHKTLHRSDGIMGVCDSLTFSGISHFTFAIFQKSHDRRGCTASFDIGNDHRLVAFHYRYAGIGGS